jgi:hypothetical protein
MSADAPTLGYPWKIGNLSRSRFSLDPYRKLPYSSPQGQFDTPRRLSGSSLFVLPDIKMRSD